MTKKRQLQIHKTYMDIAEIIAQLSYAKRNKVGAIIVKDKNILSFGFNGTPSGFDNNCEIKDKEGNLITKSEVLHAETNALAKLTKQTNSSDGAILYQTLSPCFECAKLIIQSGIKEVYYKTIYRDTNGIKLLKKAKIKVVQLC